MKTILQKAPTIVFIGTYPPRECGIATFTQDLLHASQKIVGAHVTCKVAALNVSPLDTHRYPHEVEWKIDQNDRQEYRELADILNNDPLITGVIIQHEYGIYGGANGNYILSFMEKIKKPLVVTLHTVLPDPDPKMKKITRTIIAYANVIIVLTKTSKKVLEELYPTSIGKVYVVPHGIHYVRFSGTKTAKKKLKLQDSTVLSTFGLLSRGKGLEYVIKALPSVIKKDPSVIYLILGKTHPVVRRHEGEKYRVELLKLVTSLHLKKHVKFYDQYLSLRDLLEFLKATDIYISTSINPNQAVSGTLSYALGTGRAVVSTEFAQAKEIITKETGKLVPIKDSRSMSNALIELLANKKNLKQMHSKAYETTRPMLWNNVANQYVELLEDSPLPPLNLSHLQNMTDSFGLFQFARLSTPNEKFGYTLDDNARALVICMKLFDQHYPSQEIENLIGIYMNFIEKCQLPDGTFINYINHADKTPTLQNGKEDLTDAFARAMWALSEVIHNTYVAEKIKVKAQKIFFKALPHSPSFPHLRAHAFMIKACALVQESSIEKREDLDHLMKHHARALMRAAYQHSSKEWNWFSDSLEYNNAILPESLFIAGNVLKVSSYTKVAKRTFAFLIDKTFTTNMYIPIGHSHWYRRSKKRSNFDQQPEDPSSMILALVTAYKITHNEAYRNLADKCFRWFLGNNSLHLPLYNDKNGGCYDGLHPDRVNQNQGAESLVSYLLSRLAIANLLTEKRHEDSSNKKYIS